MRALRAEFERVRVDVLMRCVRRDTLRTEVRSMRERMRKELSNARRVRASSTSSRTRAAPPTSSSWRSTGRCCMRARIRRW